MCCSQSGSWCGSRLLARTTQMKEEAHKARYSTLTNIQDTSVRNVFAFRAWATTVRSTVSPLVSTANSTFSRQCKQDRPCVGSKRLCLPCTSSVGTPPVPTLPNGQTRKFTYPPGVGISCFALESVATLGAMDI